MARLTDEEVEHLIEQSEILPITTCSAAEQAGYSSRSVAISNRVIIELLQRILEKPKDTGIRPPKKG
jgi:hypothetical protein